MADSYESLLAEVKRLRDWRHDVVTPQLTALKEQQKMTATLLARTAETVSEMRSEDEFAKRLAAEMRKRRWGALSNIERAAVAVFAAVPLADLILHLTGHG